MTFPSGRSIRVAVTSALQGLILSDAYVMQQKIDGQRFILSKTEYSVVGYNKRYIQTPVPKFLREATDALGDGEWVFDGELCDDGYHIFDFLTAPNGRLDDLGFSERAMALKALIYNWDVPKIRTVPIWFTAEEQLAALLRLRSLGAEGVIFRSKDRPPAYDGETWKYKFYQTLDCIVTERFTGGKDAVSIAVVYDSRSGQDPLSNLAAVGNVGVSKAQQEKLKLYDVVEVRHRGLTNDLILGGKLREPVFLRKRTDKKAFACTEDQFYSIEENDAFIHAIKEIKHALSSRNR